MSYPAVGGGTGDLTGPTGYTYAGVIVGVAGGPGADSP